MSIASSAIVYYVITNNTTNTRTLILKPTTGITQSTTDGFCASPFTLNPQQSCTMALTVNGQTLADSSVFSLIYSPTVCKTIGSGNNNPDAFLCARSSFANSLNITVSQVPITLSTSSLALQASGQPRTLLITALANANDVHYSIAPALPNGTTISPSSCGDMLQGETCLLTITPSSTPSAQAGATPDPSIITVQGMNTNILTAAITVLTFGSQYQEGYVFKLDDTTPTSGSVGGTIAALADNSTAIRWDNGDDSLDTNTDGHLFDGASNTINIIDVEGAGQYAATLCHDYDIDSAGHTPCQPGYICYNNWFLPAICQLGPTDASGECLGAASMYDNLVSLTPSVGNFSTTELYWASTQYKTQGGLFYAWYELFSSTPNPEIASTYDLLGVRCAKAMTL